MQHVSVRFLEKLIQHKICTVALSYSEVRYNGFKEECDNVSVNSWSSVKKILRETLL